MPRQNSEGSGSLEGALEQHALLGPTDDEAPSDAETDS
jgi:hypothetical protein